MRGEHVAQRWQLKTWTKGTGATVEPVGAADRPPARARPGGLTSLPPKRPWAPAPPRSRESLPKPRVSSVARHRHALGYLDAESVERLETLENEVLQATGTPSAGDPSQGE
jgi:hypothetical protein